MTTRSWLMRGVRGWPAYTIASALVGCIAIARYALGGILGDGVPLFPFVMAILGASLIGGLYVGLYATAVSGVVGELLFVRPYGVSPLTDAAEALRFGIFLVEGVLVAGVVELLRRARADAIRANDEKDAFIAMLAHEFRNPINAVQTAVGVMKTRQTDERRTWARDLIERQATVMSRLVDDLLDAARIRRQQFDQPQLRPTALRPILD